MGVDAITQPMPPLVWICQSLRIAAGAPTLLSGYGYSGKSIAAQTQALAVASGRSLWGKFAMSPGRALHLDYEQGKRITFDRYQRLMHAQGIEPEEVQGSLEVGVLPSVGLSLDSLKRLGEGRTLIVIDSWKASHPGVDENSSDVRKTLDHMTTASEVTGCAFEMIHHNRKPQKDAAGGQKMSIRGSSGFFDGCQTVYIFDGIETGRVRVTLEKDRIGGQNVDAFEITIRDDDDGGLLVSYQSAQIVEAVAPARNYIQTVAVVRAMVAADPGISSSKLAETAGKNKSTVLAAVNSLIAEGVIVRTGSGPTTKLYIKGAQPSAPF